MDNIIGILPLCGHYFHYGCIWEWLKKRESCCYCRKTTKLKPQNLMVSVYEFIINNKIQNIHKEYTTNQDFITSSNSHFSFYYMKHEEEEENQPEEQEEDDIIWISPF